MVREGLFIEATLKLRLEGLEGANVVRSGNRIVQAKEKAKCKGPDAGKNMKSDTEKGCSFG
jgi:hypothetical protein